MRKLIEALSLEGRELLGTEFGASCSKVRWRIWRFGNTRNIIPREARTFGWSIFALLVRKGR